MPSRAINSISLFVILITLPVVMLAVKKDRARKPQTPPTVAPFPDDSAISAILRERVQQKRSAGIVVGMLEPDGRTRFFAYGDPGPNRPPLDSNSVFEIGSITKVFTATMLAQMVKEGRVRLDDPAQKFVPSSVTLPTHDGKEITLGSLSEQNSGLPRMPTNFHPANSANPYADYTVQQMYAFLSGYKLTRDPGASFEYSNLGVGLLGQLLSAREGKPYEALVRERILDPLGMTHTAVTLSPWMTDHLALGHGEDGSVVPGWDLPTFAGAGALRSTASDMLRFLDANLHPERGVLQRAMAFAHQERASIGAPDSRIGLNWITLHAGADTIVWHNGGTGGYRTFAGIEPSKKIGVIVLTNSGGTSADDIGLHLLAPHLPLAPAPEPQKARTTVDVSRTVLSRYTGTYRLAPDFSFDVTLVGDSLFAQATAQPRFRLWAETDSTFFLKEVDAQITFEIDAQKGVTALVLHQNGQNQTAQKMR